ncbi:MAG: Hsp33 family molecular chaperone HslO [Rhodocyclaceae bacterium]|nr:Hsp33 family molecular chaperone HslO [Rhodocyclaceae bacterium]
MLRETDRFVRFHFPELAIRGAWVHLDETYRALIAGRNYPAAVSRMLGEMASVTALMAGQLKHPGRLTFQMRDPGPISLLVMDCTNTLGLRGTAQWDATFAPQLQNPDFQCLNTYGDEEDTASRLMMTLDAQQFSTPWQSFVPLVGQSLSQAFGHYLTQSEQQPTLLTLAADDSRAAALFLQAMPGADEADADGWNRLTHLFGTLTNHELLQLDPAPLLTRLFPEELISLAPGQALHHAGERNWDKVRNMVRGLGKDEVDAILREHGAVVIHDELSNQEYRFSPDEALALFAADSTEGRQGQTLH